MEPGQRNLSLPPGSGPGPPAPRVPLGHELPAHLRRLRAGCAPPARSPGGGGGVPGLSLCPSAGLPPTPCKCPTLAPWGRGRPASPPRMPSALPRAGVPTLQQAPEPGQHLVSTLGGGGGGGRALPLAPSPPDGRRGLRGAPGGPGSPRAVRQGRGALPCAPRAAGLGSSHRPRRDRAGRDGAGRAGAGRRRPVPAPPSSAGGARAGQSVGPCAPAARRGRVGTARKLFPTTPTPSRTR